MTGFSAVAYGRSTGDGRFQRIDGGGKPVSAAIARAAPNYMPLTIQANSMALRTGQNALLDGPYLKEKLPQQK